MPDRIYVTFTPTTVPGTYHAAIHYERSDPTGTITKHVVIEAQPENLDKLSAEDKALGVIEEAFRNDDGPSRFGRIVASASEQSADKARNDPFETIAEGDDLSEHLARMAVSRSTLIMPEVFQY